MKLIVKRAGHNEQYDQRKLYASIFAACLAVREPAGSAELIASEVCKHVEAWLGDKHEVTSADIFRHAAKHLGVIQPDAGYIYSNHRNVARG